MKKLGKDWDGADMQMLPVNKAKRRKKHTKNQRTVLERLEKFLEQEVDGPVLFLTRFFEDQGNSLTYKELREAVEYGDLTPQQYQQFNEDYSLLVQQKLIPLWTKACVAGAMSQPILEGLDLHFNVSSDGIRQWITNRGANFVTVVTEEQKGAIASLLAKKLDEHMTVDDLARLIRPCVGLNQPQTEATIRVFNNALKTLLEDNPNMRMATAKKKAHHTALVYAQKKHRERAMLIANTELEFAYAYGADRSIRQAIDEGLISPNIIKIWSTAGDDNVCKICRALNGVPIGLDEEFDYGGRELYTHRRRTPPAHPRCACALLYEEVEG